MRRRSRPPLQEGHYEAHRPYSLENAARAVASGDPAFRFWFSQRTIPLDMVARRSKIDVERLFAFSNGALKPTAEEARVLAAILRCEPSDLLRE